MILSAVTSIYVGGDSCSKAYVGDTLVWPMEKGYHLQSGVSLNVGDKFVLINNDNKKIVGRDGGVNVDFNGFNGNGVYSALPRNTSIFMYSTNGVAKFENGVCANSDNYIEYSQYNVIGRLNYGCSGNASYVYSVLSSRSVMYGTSVRLCYSEEYGYPVFLHSGSQYNVYRLIEVQ